MSYAIIRNENYKMGQLSYIYRHNERKNTHYSNKEIHKQNSQKNYSIKNINTSYQKAFNDLKQKYNLKGQIKKVSNVVCELIITSDKDFFDNIGEDKTREYFETAYNFVANYQNLGEEFILSAKVHLDESTPHLHIVFIPVVHTKDKKGKEIKKIACSEFWKGRESYKILQDKFYKCVTDNGFDLERGNTKNNEHIDIERLKTLTNYELQQFEKKSIQKEQPIQTNNAELLKTQNKRIINKFNTLSNQYIKIKNNVYMIQKINQKLENEKENLKFENEELREENKRLEKENNKLKHYIEKTFEYVSLLFDFSKERLKRLVNTYIYDLDKNKHK